MTENTPVARILTEIREHGCTGSANFLVLIASCPEMTTLATRVHEFAAILTQRRSHDLAAWITTTRLDKLPGFVS